MSADTQGAVCNIGTSNIWGLGFVFMNVMITNLLINGETDIYGTMFVWAIVTCFNTWVFNGEVTFNGFTQYTETVDSGGGPDQITNYAFVETYDHIFTGNITFQGIVQFNNTVNASTGAVINADGGVNTHGANISAGSIHITPPGFPDPTFTVNSDGTTIDDDLVVNGAIDANGLVDIDPSLNVQGTVTCYVLVEDPP